MLTENSKVVQESFEQYISKAIEPIRYYVLAIAIFHLFHSGIYRLIKTGHSSIKALAENKNLSYEKLQGYFYYLQNENLVSVNEDRVSLSKNGLALESAEPWYTMLIGGYGLTFHEILENFSENAPGCSRNSALVGIGSCGISHYDAIPLTKNLISYMPHTPTCLLDLGCGNAKYLTEFCKIYPELKAIGVEPSAEGFLAANEHIKATLMENRVTLYNLSAQDFINHTNSYKEKPDLLILGFVLHEILGQDGVNGVKEFFQKILNKFPNIYFIIIEVENKINDPVTMKHPFATTYYNPYYLLHYFTKQKLINKNEWLNIFSSIGLHCIKILTTDPKVDSTGLEIGFLLHKEP